MTAKELFQAGRLDEAVQALGAELRSDPTDTRRRIFLFELLCFAGEFDRAEKQLDIIAQSGREAGMGALLYRGALHAERLRHDLFAKKDYPSAPAGDEPAAGSLNGKPFESIEDADPRIGARLEIFAAGAYLWLPFKPIASVEMQSPKRLRDLLWIPAIVRPGPSFQGAELGEVLLPALCVFSSKHPKDDVRLGRMTEWEEQDGVTAPAGQKMLLVDDEEVPILEVRKLEFAIQEEAAAGPSES